MTFLCKENNRLNFIGLDRFVFRGLDPDTVFLDGRARSLLEDRIRVNSIWIRNSFVETAAQINRFHCTDSLICTTSGGMRTTSAKMSHSYSTLNRSHYLFILYKMSISFYPFLYLTEALILFYPSLCLSKVSFSMYLSIYLK